MFEIWSHQHLSCSHPAIRAAAFADQMQAYSNELGMLFEMIYWVILAGRICRLPWCHLLIMLPSWLSKIAFFALEHIFPGKTVLGMDDQQIREIAEKPLNIQKDREGLNEELERLREGR